MEEAGTRIRAFLTSTPELCPGTVGPKDTYHPSQSHAPSHGLIFKRREMIKCSTALGLLRVTFIFMTSFCLHGSFALVTICNLHKKQEKRQIIKIPLKLRHKGIT